MLVSGGSFRLRRSHSNLSYRVSIYQLRSPNHQRFHLPGRIRPACVIPRNSTASCPERLPSFPASLAESDTHRHSASRMQAVPIVSKPTGADQPVEALKLFREPHRKSRSSLLSPPL